MQIWWITWLASGESCMKALLVRPWCFVLTMLPKKTLASSLIWTVLFHCACDLLCFWITQKRETKTKSMTKQDSWKSIVKPKHRSLSSLTFKRLVPVLTNSPVKMCRQPAIWLHTTKYLPVTSHLSDLYSGQGCFELLFITVKYKLYLSNKVLSYFLRCSTFNHYVSTTYCKSSSFLRR